MFTLFFLNKDIGSEKEKKQISNKDIYNKRYHFSCGFRPNFLSKNPIQKIN